MSEKRPAPVSTDGKNTGIALITGAAQRIGRAIALDLAAHGWDIAIHYRSSAEEAEDLAGEVEALGRKTALIGADLADLEAVQAIIPECAGKIGPPACLVNNASLFQEDAFRLMDPQGWDRHMAVNLRAPVFLAQGLAANLPHSEAGNVVNIVDQRVLKPAPDFFSYTVSKAGLWWATRTMAQALAPRIRVNAVSPGPVLPSIHQTADEFQDEWESTLLKRGAPPGEIAAAVRYLLDAPAVTGQMIAVDGGQHLSE